MSTVRTFRGGRPELRWGVLTVLAIIPAVGVLLATRRGVGISIDSVSYVAAAHSIARGDGVLGFDGLPLTIFPPGYPALLGSLLLTGSSVSTAAIAVNVACVVLVVIGTYLLAREVMDSPNQALLVAAFVSLTAATTRTASFAWSEGPFTVVVLAVLIMLARAVRRQSGTWALTVAVGLLSAVAITFRYAGVAVLPAVAWGVWRAWPGRRLLPAVVAVMAGLGGLAGIAARNLSLGSGPMGERYPGSFTIEGAVASMVQLLGGYVVPRETSSLTPVLGVIVVILLAGSAWVAWLRAARPAQLVAVFVVAYWAVIVYGQTAARLDVATERLAAPVLPAMVALAAYGVREIGLAGVAQVVRAERLTMRVAHGAFIGLGSLALAAILGLSMLQGLRFVRTAGETGLGIESTASVRQVVAAAARLPSGAGLAANEPWPIWWARQTRAVLELPPSPAEWPQARVTLSLERLVDAVRDGRVSYVVFSDSGPRALPERDLEAAGLELELVEQLPDGRIYSVMSAD